MRAWGLNLAVLVTAVAVAGGTTTATAEETDRLTGGDAAHAEAGDLAAASTIVPMPDLGITHRLPGGGMNLWRIPLSELENGYGVPQLVKTLNFGGFSYDNSRTITGDFGDITPSDDGTADHIIWHAQPNGGVLLWAVGGGGDTTPRLWQDLRTGGWSYANSRPMVGDVTGDGWDDLVVRHRLTADRANVWVFPSDGSRLGAPELWFQEPGSHLGWDDTRHLLMDVDADGLDDWVFMQPTWWPNSLPGLYTFARLSTGSNFVSHPSYGGVTAIGVFNGYESGGGWSFANSRQLAADVSGDGRDDLVTIHLQTNGGILVWVHEHCFQDGACVTDPQIWQDLRTGGWSFAGSRQQMADTNGDGAADLISMHSQVGNPGLLVWRHVSDSVPLTVNDDNTFSPPQVIANLKTGGWTYSVSREGVADTYGLVG